MNICFIEDTPLHGGTQLWVFEAVRAFMSWGASVTLLAPQDSWMVAQCKDTGARIVTYDWDGVVDQDELNQAIWIEALRNCEVAVCTVHPPRNGFHCSVFAAKCIKKAD